MKRNQRILLADDTLYEGNTKNGIPHGKGKTTKSLLNHTFVGKYKEGHSEGKGKLNMFINNIFFIGGDFGVDEKSPISTFSVFTENWKINPLPSCRYPRSVGKLVFHEHYFYYIGGFDGNRAVPHVERMDILSGKWQDLSPLIYRRASLSCFYYESNIYVCGGVMGNVVHSSIEKYNFKENKWEIFGHLSLERSGLIAHVWEDKCFVFGGLNTQNRSTLPMEIYDLKLKKSVTYPNIVLPTFGSASALIEIDHKPFIFIAGGSLNRRKANQTITNNVFLYSIQDNSFSKIANLNIGRTYCALVVFQNELYCMGGFTHDMEYILPCEKYSFSKENWEIQNVLPLSMSGTSVLSVEKQNISVEGNWKHGEIHGKALIMMNEKVSNGKYKMGKKEGFFDDIFYINDIPVSYKEVLWDAKMKKIKNVPDCFKCPISFEIMRNPVLIESGITFDKKYIEEWFIHKNTCPLTRKIVDKKCIPNYVLKTMILEFIDQKMSSSSRQ